MLVISDSDNVGGVEKRFSNLYKHYLFNPPIDYTIIFLVNKRLYKKIQNYKTPPLGGSLYLVTFGHSFELPRAFRKLFRILDFISVIKWVFLNNVKYDRIIFTTTRSIRFSLLLNATKRIATVYAYTIKKDNKLFKFYEKISQKNNFVFDCLSENIAKELSKSIVINKKAIYISSNSFIDFENTDNCFSQKEDLVCFAARFEQKKGVDLLLNAITYVLELEKTIKFFILGYGPMEKQIYDFLESNNLSDRVSVKYVEDIKPILSKSKIFLSLQLEENYPSQSLLEAMACKNVIIATNVGLTYKLVDNLCGKLVIKDPIVIADAILQLFNLPNSLIQAMGEESRRRIISEHTPENYHNYIINI